MTMNDVPRDTGPIARARDSGTREHCPICGFTMSGRAYCVNCLDFTEPSHIARAQSSGSQPDAQSRPRFVRFTLADDEPIAEPPSWHTRHDDICPIKRARWEGVFVGIAIGIVLTMAAVAWRSFGTLLP